MGFRFRRSIKLFPGLRINVSKSGVSASVGKPGATLNISERGTRATIGIPGTGVSYSERLDLPLSRADVEAPTSRPDPPDDPAPPGSSIRGFLMLAVMGLVIWGLWRVVAG